MPRVLIITAGQLSRNPRALKEAETLGRAGHEVTVLHVRNHAASEAHDAVLERNGHFRRVVVDELAPGVSRLRRRAALWLARKMISGVGWQSPRTLGPVDRLLRYARRLPADLTIVHNEVAHAVGLRLHAEGRRVAADIEDWHSEDLLPADRKHRPIKLLVNQERALLHALPHTTTTSGALAEGVHQRYGGRRPCVLTNSFPLQNNPRSAQSQRSDAPPVFCWFSQRLGPGRGLEAFLDAWQGTRQASRIVLLGEPQLGYREALLARLPSARRDQIQFADCVSPAALPQTIARHDIGLALEDPAILNRDLTITNKILQYLNAGLAIVATNTAGQREVLARSPDSGVLVDATDVNTYTASLDRMLADRNTLAHRQRAARRLAEEHYCWEREAPRLLELVEKVIALSAIMNASR